MKQAKTVYVGITGRAGAGKDTFASMLREHLDNYMIISARFALADALKLAAVSLFNVDHMDIYDRKYKEVKREGEFSELSIREMLQRLGTCVRKEFGEDFFIRNLRDTIESYSAAEAILVTDVRYQNEAAWILSHPKSLLISVDRPGTVDGTNYAHSSENGIDFLDLMKPDSIVSVLNDGTLEDLNISAERLAVRIAVM